LKNAPPCDDQIAKAREMRDFQRAGSANRHAHAVNGDGIGLADRRERPMRRAAGAHIVFGVNFEETVLQPVRENCRQVFVLETGTDEIRDTSAPAKGATPLTHYRRLPGVTHSRPHSSCRSLDQDLIGVREPWPPPGTSMLVHVPP
jgi:hypothetical protein